MFQNKLFRQIDNSFPFAVTWYIILFALYSVISRFTLTRLGIEGIPNTIIYTGLSLIGVLLSVYGFFRNRKDILYKKNFLFLMLIGILICSSLLNYQYDLVGNIKTILIFFTHFVLFYSVSLFLTKEQFVKCLKRLFLIINVIWVSAAAASLVLYLLNIKYPLKYVDHRVIRQGFVQGRLFGFFADPNFAAFTSLLILFGLVYILMGTKRADEIPLTKSKTPRSYGKLFSGKLFRIFLYTSLVINLLYMIMSNSRTVFIAIVISIMMFVLLHTKRKEGHLTKKRIFFRLFSTLLAILVIYFISFGAMTLAGLLISPKRNTESLVRDDMNLENISNNRFTIWGHYLDLYKNKPVLGTSPRGVFPYAEQIDPRGYLAETKYEVHNGYLSLLVTAGMAGFLTMLFFYIRQLRQIKSLICSDNRLNHENILCITFLVMISIFTFFFTNIFFTNNIETMLLWLSFGALKYDNA